MSYIIKQMVKEPDSSTPSAKSELVTKYMTLVDSGVAITVKRDTEVGAGATGPFYDSGVKTLMKRGVNYYFHAKVKRMDTVQTFNIKLINSDFLDKTQKIKKFIVQEGSENDWVDCEFIFTPAADFDTILFELVRDNDTSGGRTPVILYEELSIINNILDPGLEAVKIGVQSQPGLMMCINGQEIRVGRSGIYELRNQALKITKFSVVAPAETTARISLPISSECIFHLAKIRVIPAFVLDYMYEKED